MCVSCVRHLAARSTPDPPPHTLPPPSPQPPLAHLFCSVDVGGSIEQKAHNVQMTVLGRDGERGRSSLRNEVRHPQHEAGTFGLLCPHPSLTNHVHCSTPTLASCLTGHTDPLRSLALACSLPPFLPRPLALSRPLAPSLVLALAHAHALAHVLAPSPPRSLSRSRSSQPLLPLPCPTSFPCPPSPPPPPSHLSPVPRTPSPSPHT